MTTSADVNDLRHKLKQLSKTPLFQKDTLSLSKEDKIKHLYSLMEKVTSVACISADDITSDMNKFLVVMESPCLMTNYGLCPLLASHYNLCLGTILNLAGRNRPHLQKYIDELERVETKGIYMVTEIAYGNNAMSMQTKATFDKNSQEFIITTPSPSACKFMPYLSSDEQPKLAIVMARLWLEEKDCGIHPFVVRCRDRNGKLLPGVQASKLSTVDLYSVSDVDHSITAFYNIRIPFYAFLGGDLNEFTPDGEFITSAKNQREIFFNSLCRVEWGKIVLTAALMSPFKMSIATAIEYAKKRKLTTRSGERALMEFQYYKAELSKAYTYLIASICLYEKMKNLCLNKDIKLETLAIHAAITKSGCVEIARDALNICLARTGAQGKMVRNRIISACILNDITSTAEGDSIPVLLRIARHLISQEDSNATNDMQCHLPVTSATRLVTLLSTRESQLKSQLQQTIRTSADKEMAWNDATSIALELAWVHVICHAADALSGRERIQKVFCALFIMQYAAWYNAIELISSSEMNEIIVFVDQELPEIFDKYAINVADEFELHDLIAQTGIGHADMAEYWSNIAGFNLTNPNS
ncbi:hypothetical protein [Klebsiella aerogenes]|uniref:Uncharacterized protein n=1 Tax=Klebsiella aerogenes TaxID=548 RepID=A0AAP9R226_KLEAE|nr:hypothetical protein [Klebsiella aerogenes]QMR43156.1 hypothetical protein HV331_27200 [Klebsiella aerogenes]